MTVKTRAELTADIELFIADNASRAISEEDVRQRLLDIVDSAVLPEDDALGDISPFMQTLLDDADAATARATLGIVQPVIYKQQPVTDVTTISFTGLSIHKTIECSYALQVNPGTGSSMRALLVEARAAGGTFRTALQLNLSTGNNPYVAGGRFTIDGFGDAHEKVCMGWSATGGANTVLDSSNATNLGNANATSAVSMPSWDEAWDEIRLSLVDATSFEGSTTDERGYVFVRGT